MPIFNMVGGGGNGGSTPFAFILVTYPSGSTVTCTNSSGSENISSTKKLFYINSGAVPFNCVVTATDGSKTKSKNVSITYQGQSVSVAIVYDFVLWDSSMSQSSWAFIGMKYSSASTNNAVVPNHSVSGGVLNITESNGGSGTRGSFSYYTNAVDLTPYTTLKLTGTIHNGDAAEDGCGLCVFESLPTYTSDTALAVANVGARNSTLTNPSVSVANINRTATIGIKLISRSDAQYGQGTASITSLILSA